MYADENGIVRTGKDRLRFPFDKDANKKELEYSEELKELWSKACRMKIAEVYKEYTNLKNKKLGILYECPCCGYKTLDEEPPGTFNICSLCGWEDDEVQLDDPDYRGGANECSLNECRQQFVEEELSGNELLGQMWDCQLAVKKAIRIYMATGKLKLDWIRVDPELKRAVAELNKADNRYKDSMEYCEYLETFVELYEL